MERAAREQTQPSHEEKGGERALMTRKRFAVNDSVLLGVPRNRREDAVIGFMFCCPYRATGSCLHPAPILGFSRPQSKHLIRRPLLHFVVYGYGRQCRPNTPVFANCELRNIRLLCYSLIEPNKQAPRQIAVHPGDKEVSSNIFLSTQERVKKSSTRPSRFY